MQQVIAKADSFFGANERDAPFLTPAAFGIPNLDHAPEEPPYHNPVRMATSRAGRSPTTIEVTWRVRHMYDNDEEQVAYATVNCFTIINSIFETFEEWNEMYKPRGGWLSRYGTSDRWGFKLFYPHRLKGGVIDAAYKWWKQGQFGQADGDILVPLSNVISSKVKLGAGAYNLLNDVESAQSSWAANQDTNGVFHTPFGVASRMTSIAFANEVLFKAGPPKHAITFEQMATRRGRDGAPRGKGGQAKGKGAGTPTTHQGGRAGGAAIENPSSSSGGPTDPRIGQAACGQGGATAGGPPSSSSGPTDPRVRSHAGDQGDEAGAMPTAQRNQPPKKAWRPGGAGAKTDYPPRPSSPTSVISYSLALDAGHRLSRVAIPPSVQDAHSPSSDLTRASRSPQVVDRAERSVLRIELKGGENNCFLAAIVACGLGKVYPPSNMASICKTLRTQLSLSEKDALTPLEQRRVLQYYCLNTLILLENQTALYVPGPRGARRWAVLSVVSEHHVALVLGEKSLRPLILHSHEVMPALASMGVSHLTSGSLGPLGMDSPDDYEPLAEAPANVRPAEAETPAHPSAQTAMSVVPLLPRGHMHAARVDPDRRDETTLASPHHHATPPQATLGSHWLRGGAWPMGTTSFTPCRPQDLANMFASLADVMRAVPIIESPESYHTVDTSSTPHGERMVRDNAVQREPRESPPEGRARERSSYSPYEAPASRTPAATATDRTTRDGPTPIREATVAPPTMTPIVEELADREQEDRTADQPRSITPSEETPIEVRPARIDMVRVIDATHDAEGSAPQEMVSTLPEAAPAFEESLGLGDPNPPRDERTHTVARGPIETPTAGTMREPVVEELHPGPAMSRARGTLDTPIPTMGVKRPPHWLEASASSTRAPATPGPPFTATTHMGPPRPTTDAPRHPPWADRGARADTTPREGLDAGGLRHTGSPSLRPALGDVHMREPRGAVAPAETGMGAPRSGRSHESMPASLVYHSTAHCETRGTRETPSAYLPPSAPPPARPGYGTPCTPVYPTRPTPRVSLPGTTTTIPGPTPASAGTIMYLPVEVDIKTPGKKQRVWQEEPWGHVLTRLEPRLVHYAQALEDTAISLAYDGAYGGLNVRTADLVIRMHWHSLGRTDAEVSFATPVLCPPTWPTPTVHPTYIGYIAVYRDDATAPPPVCSYDLERFVNALRACLDFVPIASQEEAVVTALIDLLAPPGRRGPMESSVMPRAMPPSGAPEALSSVTVPKWDKSWVAQLSKAIPVWAKKLPIAAWHLRVVQAFKSGQCRETVPGLVSYQEGLRSLATALKACTPPHAQMLVAIYDSHLHVESVDALCDEMQTYLLELRRGGRPAESMRPEFMYCLHTLLLELRAIVHAHDMNAMGRYEARRVTERTRRSGVDDATWVRESLDLFQCFTTLWGPELSGLYIAGEMKDFLLQLVRNLHEETWKHQVMSLAEEFMKAYAKEQGCSLESLKGTVDEGRIVNAPMWRAFSSPRTTTSSTTVRFFQGPHQLRRIIELGLLSPFVHEMYLQLLGPSNYYSATAGEGSGPEDDKTTPILAIDLFDSEAAPTPHDEHGMQLVAKGTAKGKTVHFAPETTAAASGALASPPPQLERPVTVKDLEEWKKSFQASHDKYLQQLAENHQSCFLNFHRQLDNVAAHTDLHRAPVPPATAPMAAMDSRPPYSGDRRSPVAGTPPRRYDGQRDRERPPPPRQTDAGGRGFRLMDKPPTPWDDIPEHVRRYLAGLGIADKAAWDAAANVRCGVCGAYADHPWSRCVKIFASTLRGEEVLGKMNAANHLAKMLRSTGQHLVSDLEQPLAFMLAQSGAAGDAGGQAQHMLDEVCQLFNLNPEDAADALDHDIPEAMHLGQQLKQAFGAGDPSA